jgi:UvrD-like helicase C-terminal domain
MEDPQGERLVEYEREDWPELQMAHAITSHRAQGSEWGNVLVVVSQRHYMMLQRNLPYTALIRARKRAVLIVTRGLRDRLGVAEPPPGPRWPTRPGRSWLGCYPACPSVRQQARVALQGHLEVADGAP